MLLPKSGAARADLRLGFANASCPSPQESTRGKQSAVRGKSGNNESRLGCGIAQVVHQQHAAVRARIAVDQSANVMVLGEKDPIFPDGLRQQGLVTGIRCTLGGMDDIVAALAQGTDGLCHDVGIGEDAHAIQRRP